jgi:Aromatic-ring-opening dioxygenase LigAB, LigA subunit
MTDYWLSKLFYDLQGPGAAAEYRADRAKVLDRYPLKPDVRKAVEANDVPALARLVNAYLLRFYFFAIGMTDEEFIARLRKTKAPAEAHHG